MESLKTVKNLLRKNQQIKPFSFCLNMVLFGIYCALIVVNNLIYKRTQCYNLLLINDRKRVFAQLC